MAKVRSQNAATSSGDG